MQIVLEMTNCLESSLELVKMMGKEIYGQNNFSISLDSTGVIEIGR